MPLSDSDAATPLSDSDAENGASGGEASKDTAVTLVRNAKQTVRKAATLSSPTLLDELLRVAKNKLSMKPKAVYLLGGRELRGLWLRVVRR